ncbi:MAG: serine hydroxymethyltransferase [Sandaracinaceae bacterium]|nr:serine hydroxymethyltransferase [Sandaracinaceae bacterium]
MSDPHLSAADPTISELIHKEEQRQFDKVRLIPSENYVSRAVLEASGSVLSNKYSEGYAGKRYYEGQQFIDEVENLAVSRVKKLFGSDHVNVQPYSGSPANFAVYFAFCKPGDTVMGLGLPSGGHLTHGWPVSVTGSYFNAVQYGVRREDQRIDFDEVAKLAKENKPKIMWCGTTAYPRVVDYDRFAQIARDCGAILIADIAHISGLIAGGSHPSPVGKAEVITSTTHKTFRGPRGGMIMCDEKHAKAIDKAVFPGLQGGPHNSTTAGIAVAALEADTPAFKKYAHAIVENAKTFAEALMSHGFKLTTGGTDNHLILCDLTHQNVSGKIAAQALDRAGIECNYNSVPFDPRKPFDPSGIRIGTPAITSRGFGATEMKAIASWMAKVVAAPTDATLLARIAGEVSDMCHKFPAPGISLK